MNTFSKIFFFFYTPMDYRVRIADWTKWRTKQSCIIRAGCDNFSQLPAESDFRQLSFIPNLWLHWHVSSFSFVKWFGDQRLEANKKKKAVQSWAHPEVGRSWHTLGYMLTNQQLSCQCNNYIERICTFQKGRTTGPVHHNIATSKHNCCNSLLC
jgi:hypothetical protein